jgi:hypothetical protein
MVNIRWRLKNNTRQCAVPRCKNPIGPTYLGLEICWPCFDRNCNSHGRHLAKYTSGSFSKIYVLGRYFTTGELLVGVSEMGIIKLDDRVKMDPENCGAYSQFLRKGDGVIIGIHPLGKSDLGRTVQRWPLEKVGHLTVRCDNGLVIIIGPSRLVEINGFKRPDEDTTQPAIRRRPRKGIRIGPKSRKKLTTTIKPKPVKKKRRPRKKSMLDDLWG